jgi:hypothetical protein
MTASARMIWLGLGVIPYLGLVVVDAWMHERARKVPAIERITHYTSAIALLAFLAGAFSARRSLAVASLAVFIVLTAFDELGFHRHIARSERRVHFAAYASLIVFIAIWQWT